MVASTPQALPHYVPAQHPHIGQQLSQQPGHMTGHLSERAAYFSSRELRDMLSRSEQAIVSGRAQIEDYEAFVICQQELGSRA